MKVIQRTQKARRASISVGVGRAALVSTWVTPARTNRELNRAKPRTRRKTNFASQATTQPKTTMMTIASSRGRNCVTICEKVCKV